jgi:hypothetical protein
MRRVFAIIALAACGGGPGLRVAVRGDELVQHLDALGTNGSTELVTMTTDGKVADRETVFLYQTVTFRGETTTLAKVVDGCGPFAGAAKCTLGKTEYVVLRAAIRAADEPEPAQSMAPRTNGENHEVAVVAGAITLGSLAGVGICVWICEDDKAAKSIALGSVALVAAVVWAIASGAHD